jgi:hypothetical protein
MAYNIVFEIPSSELEIIYTEFRTHNLQAKINVDISVSDAIRTYFWRKGIMSWLNENMTSMYHIFFMINELHSEPSPDYYGGCKPWWRSTSRTSIHDAIPIVFRFEDSSDAMFFKMTYLEGK